MLNKNCWKYTPALPKLSTRERQSSTAREICHLCETLVLWYFEDADRPELNLLNGTETDRRTYKGCFCTYSPSHTYKNANVCPKHLWVRAACLYLHLCTLWVWKNSHLGGMTLSIPWPTIGFLWSDLALQMPGLAGDPVAACPNLWRCCWDGVTACCCKSKCQGAGNREAGHHAQQAAWECLPV